MIRPDMALSDLIEKHRTQGADEDQQQLILLLKEVQELTGGSLTQQTLTEISASLSIKETLLKALIRRIPSLRLADLPHRLEICGACKKSRPLVEYIEKQYGISSGGVSPGSGFTYHLTGCMKNCGKGPSVRWDGALYSQADITLLAELISGIPKKTPSAGCAQPASPKQRGSF